MTSDPLGGGAGAGGCGLFASQRKSLKLKFSPELFYLELHYFLGLLTLGAAEEAVPEKTSSSIDIGNILSNLVHFNAFHSISV